jgi:hypothetical protein
VAAIAGVFISNSNRMIDMNFEPVKHADPFNRWIAIFVISLKSVSSFLIRDYLPKKKLMETRKPDLFEQERQQELPGMLNVLTILTFIGCAIAYLGVMYSYYKSFDYQKDIVDLQRMRDESGENSVVYKIAEGSIEITKIAYEYRYLLLASGLIFTTMCLIGALQMRRRKKIGFTIYTIGELTPLVISAIIYGFNLFGSFMVLFSAVFAVLFVILYATQLKHMNR